MAISTKQLLRALSRLTGDPGKHRNENWAYRIKVRSSDGVECAVTLSANGHRREPSLAALNDIADRIHIDRKRILNVLADWREADLRRHLGTFTEAQLKPPTFRGR